MVTGNGIHLEDAPFIDSADHLTAELRRIDLMLRRALILQSSPSDGTHVDTDTVNTFLDTVQAINARRGYATTAAGMMLALPYLRTRFGLTAFEVDVLMLAAAGEVDLHFEDYYAALQPNRVRRPTIDLVLRLLCDEPEERLMMLEVFQPEARLFEHQLLSLYHEPDGDLPLSRLACPLLIDRRVVDFLLGWEALDARLSAFVSPRATVDLNPDHVPEALREPLKNCTDMMLNGIPVYFRGADSSAKQAAAAFAAASIDMKVLYVDARQWLIHDQTAALLPILKREAALRNALLYIEPLDILASDERGHTLLSALERLARERDAILILSVGDSMRGLQPLIEALTFEFPPPDEQARYRLWRQALKGFSVDPSVDLMQIAEKMKLNAGQIASAVRFVARSAALRSRSGNALPPISADELYVAAHAQTGWALRTLASKVEPFYRWSDLILPPRVIQQLREIVTSVTKRRFVLQDWGFGEKLNAGRAVNVLFSGASGTGKTMSAQVIAREIDLDLYKIDLSMVVDKYIGETEKNLDRIFTAAQDSNAILFFDEADALFGKRSEVKDAHDRYANVEIAYLLQKMEDYEGVVILATNLGKNMDEAFKRRMQHTVEFPVPDAEGRERIWRSIFPPQTPLMEDVNLRLLARQFELTGGNIRNVAFAAAFLAAAAETPITMQHLIIAVAREYHKIGKLPSQADFRQYYELIREQVDV